MPSFSINITLNKIKSTVFLGTYLVVAFNGALSDITVKWQLHFVKIPVKNLHVKEKGVIFDKAKKGSN